MLNKPFSELKPKIVASLNQKLQQLGITEPVTLVDGIFYHQFQDNFSKDLVLAGKSVPVIMLVGESGRLYQFAIRKILTDEDLGI